MRRQAQAVIAVWYGASANVCTRIPYHEVLAEAHKMPVKLKCLLAALFTLSIGVGMYFTVRDCGHCYIQNFVGRRSAGLNITEFAGLFFSFPSFIHTYSFSLLFTAIVQPTLQTIAIAGGWWVFINWVFELMQSKMVSSSLHIAVKKLEIDWLEIRKLPGTFDFGDMFAAVIGAICAAGTVYLFSNTRRELDDTLLLQGADKTKG